MKRFATLFLALIMVFTIVSALAAPRIGCDYNNPCYYINANNVIVSGVDGDDSYESLNYTDRVEVFCPFGEDEYLVTTNSGFVGSVYAGNVVESGYPLLWVGDKGVELRGPIETKVVRNTKLIVVDDWIGDDEYEVITEGGMPGWISLENGDIYLYSYQDSNL